MKRKKKYYTIMVVPQKAQNVFRFKISDIALYVVAGVAAVVILISVWMLYNYLDVRLKVAELNSLREENRQQKDQIREFASKLEDLNSEMEKIRQFDEKLRIITNIGENPEGGDVFGVGGPTPEEGNSVTELDKRHESLIREIKVDLENLQEESKMREESLQGLLNFLEEQKNLLLCTPSIWPTRGFVTSSFGYRRSPYTKTLRMHEGLDIANKVGTAIYATADGVVIFTGIEGSYGKVLSIDHGYGIATRYGHLDTILVKEGDKVKRGDKIATLGVTGRTTGPHLHYEVRINGVPVNPRNYILN
ncbi:MAG: peptidoglycan DD-metalloendopeptidase family protein [Deltaproteobacteria bacterium]|nr:peptidoglycan DD-metalloendopeptidase family protein [Candidatus Zymogenaceae bacterium]